MSEKTDATQTDSTQPNAVSTKRQVTATVTSTAVTVVLGAVASMLIGKVGTRVHDQIAKPQTQTNEQ